LEATKNLLRLSRQEVQVQAQRRTCALSCGLPCQPLWTELKVRRVPFDHRTALFTYIHSSTTFYPPQWANQ